MGLLRSEPNYRDGVGSLRTRVEEGPRKAQGLAVRLIFFGPYVSTFVDMRGQRRMKDASGKDYVSAEPFEGAEDGRSAYSVSRLRKNYLNTQRLNHQEV